MNKIEDLQASIEAFNFLDERFFRKRGEHPLLGVTAKSAKDSAMARMTQLYSHILTVIDSFTEEERTKMLSGAMSTIVPPVEVTPRSDSQVKPENSTKAPLKPVKNVKQAEKEIARQEKAAEQAILDEEQQEKDEASSKVEEVGTSSETPASGENETSSEAEVDVETFIASEEAAAESTKPGKREVSPAERLAFDQKLKVIFKESNEKKRTFADAHKTAIEMLKEFFVDSTETQLCGKTTSNNKERNRYINQLRGDMKNERKELKIRTREILKRLKEEAIRLGNDINKPDVLEGLQNAAMAEAERMMNQKKAELNRTKEEMDKKNKDKIVEEAHTQAVEAETSINEEQAGGSPNTGEDTSASEEAGGSPEEEFKDTPAADDKLNETLPTAEDITTEGDDDPVKEEYDEAVAQIEEKLSADPTLIKGDGMEGIVENGTELTVANIVPESDNTKVLSPEEIQAGKAYFGTSASEHETSSEEAEANPEENTASSAEAAAMAVAEEESASEESKSIIEMSFVTSDELVKELRGLIYNKAGSDGKERLDFHDNRNDCLVAVQTHYKSQAWSNNAASVHKYLNQILSDFIKETKKAA